MAWLVQVGAGKRCARDTAQVLEQRTPAAIGANMAPANGLYLVAVQYDEDDLTNWSNTRQQPMASCADLCT